MQKVFLSLLFISAYACSFKGGVVKIDRSTYYEVFEKETDLPGMDLYAFDSAGYANFIKNESPAKLTSVLYSFFEGDTLQTYPKLIESTAPNCKKAMLDEIKAFTQSSINKRQTMVNKFVFTNHLINLKTKTDYISNSLPAKRLIVLYGKIMGRNFRNFYNEAEIQCRLKDYKLIILTLDPVF